MALQKVFHYIQDRKGNVVAGSTLQIKEQGGSNATLYEDDGTTPKDNPLTSDSNGLVECKVESGTYDYVIVNSDFSETIEDVVVANPDVTTEFGDDVFRIQDDGDDTKEIAFQASAITTGTVRTIIMPDANVDLTRLNAMEDNADVTDETNVVASLDGATIADITPVATDKVLLQDISNSDALKSCTVQEIADFATGGASTVLGFGFASSGSSTSGTGTQTIQTVAYTPVSSTSTIMLLGTAMWYNNANTHVVDFTQSGGTGTFATGVSTNCCQNAVSSNIGFIISHNSKFANTSTSLTTFLFRAKGGGARTSYGSSSFMLIEME